MTYKNYEIIIFSICLIHNILGGNKHIDSKQKVDEVQRQIKDAQNTIYCISYTKSNYNCCSCALVVVNPICAMLDYGKCCLETRKKTSSKNFGISSPTMTFLLCILIVMATQKKSFSLQTHFLQTTELDPDGEERRGEERRYTQTTAVSSTYCYK